MNGWLVIARCGMDDVPMRMFPTRGDAGTWAAALTPDDVAKAAAKIMGVDASIILGVDILEFDGGKPREANSLADFDSVNAGI